jgi:nucleotide-binding universal stress UspA family protein
MKTFQNILFPVDFSERSRAMRPLVEQVVRQFNATLTLLHVLQIPVGVFSDGGAAYPYVVDLDAMRADARDLLVRFGAEGKMDAAGKHIIVGDPATEIAVYAKKHAIDLIMLPTHGYGTFRSLLLGSVASKVLHDVDCPVWTDAHADPALQIPLKTVLAAIDLTDNEIPVLRNAGELAAALGAPLKVVHAVPGAVMSHLEGAGEDFRNFLLDSARERLKCIQLHAGTKAEMMVVAGHVDEVVRDAVLSTDAGLLVIGRGVAAATFGRLRTRSYEIIRSAPCSVLSI